MQGQAHSRTQTRNIAAIRGVVTVPRRLGFPSIDGARTERTEGISRSQPTPYAVGTAGWPTVEISPPDIVRRRAMVGGAFAAESVQCVSQEIGSYRFRAPMHLLVAYERGECCRGETLLGDLPPSALQNLERKLTFVPAGHEYRAWHEPRTRPHFLYIYFDPRILKLDLGSVAPRMFFENLTLWHTLSKLKNLVEAPASGDRPYFEALGNVLVHELGRLNRGTPTMEPVARGGLAAWQQRTVTSYIEENLARQIPLKELAHLVRLSPHHFCRSFTRSLGLPPHRYQISRRIERGKLLLEKPGVSITDVAMEMGFSSSNSFATAFRRNAGLTPTAYRRRFAHAPK
jgi:AraC family transcriptional regulator